jgi:hypothetical protein
MNSISLLEKKSILSSWEKVKQYLAQDQFGRPKVQRRLCQVQGLDFFTSGQTGNGICELHASRAIIRPRRCLDWLNAARSKR